MLLMLVNSRKRVAWVDNRNPGTLENYIYTGTHVRETFTKDMVDHSQSQSRTASA